MATITNTNTASVKTTITAAGKAFSIPDGSYTGKYALGIETVIPAGSVNLELDVTVPFATIQIVGMSMDQPGTVKMNSTSAPTETFAMSSTSGLVWGVDHPITNPIGTNITKLYVSCPGASDARFHFSVVWN